MRYGEGTLSTNFAYQFIAESDSELVETRLVLWGFWLEAVREELWQYCAGDVVSLPR